MIIVQFLKDFGELISITLIPIIIWFLGIRFQNRKSKLDAKMNLFLKLMANRKSTPISKDWVNSLNQIDVVFQDEPKVRNAWRAYLDSLHPQSQHFDSQNSFQLDLLSEIASALNYKDLKQTEIDRVYSPQAFGNALIEQDKLYAELIRVLANSKSFGVEIENEVDNSNPKSDNI